MRAVADDHAAALSIGIPLQAYLGLVWATAGVVALVAGMLWGARSGVQFALVWVALKALPVLIIGGFTSVPGVDRRRPDHRRVGKARRGLSSGPMSAAASKAGSRTCWPSCSC